MGGKQEQRPPSFTLPGPTAEEVAIQQQQLEMLKKQNEHFDRYFAQSDEDRAALQQSLKTLTDGRDLTPEEIGLIGRLGNQYEQNYLEGIKSGIVGQQLDRNRADSIADLSQRGVLGSTVGRQIIGDIEKERSRLIGQGSQEAAMQRLMLEKEFRNNATNAELARSQILSGVQGQLGQIATNLSGQATQLGNSLSSRMASERYNQAQIANQNRQQQFLFNNRDTGQGVGSKILGGGLALAGAGIGGMLGGPLGAGVGLSLGGTLGGSFSF